MVSLPDQGPKQLSLGPLEREILERLWGFGEATVKDIHDQILSDPDRELAYSSVTTVLQRLAQKGWVTSEKQGKCYRWRPLVSEDQAQSLQAYDHLQKFLSVGNPDVVAAFADRLDHTSIEQLQAIADRLHRIRQARETS